MVPDDIVLVGVTGMWVVAMLVQAVKIFRVPKRWWPTASLVAGFVVAAVWELAKLYPDATRPWVEVLVAGLLLGTGASGVYTHLKGKE